MADEFHLECKGKTPGPRFLDGHTQDGLVTLAPGTVNFSGTLWRRRILDGDVWTLECLGDIQNPEHRFLDGRTQDGSVGLAPHTRPPFSGTRWRATKVAGGFFVLECLGDFKNPAFRFLDGRTGDGSVGLAPSTDPPFTGTMWDRVGPPIDPGSAGGPVDE